MLERFQRHFQKMDRMWVLEAKISLKQPILAINPLKLPFLTSNWPLTPKLAEPQNPSNIHWGTSPMAKFLRMYHGWVLEAKICLKLPVLGISPLKLRFLTSNWHLRLTKSNFLSSRPLQQTLGHNSYDIFHKNGLYVGSRSQNQHQIADFSY